MALHQGVCVKSTRSIYPKDSLTRNEQEIVNKLPHLFSLLPSREPITINRYTPVLVDTRPPLTSAVFSGYTKIKCSEGCSVVELAGVEIPTWGSSFADWICAQCSSKTKLGISAFEPWWYASKSTIRWKIPCHAVKWCPYSEDRSLFPRSEWLKSSWLKVVWLRWWMNKEGWNVAF